MLALEGPRLVEVFVSKVGPSLVKVFGVFVEFPGEVAIGITGNDDPSGFLQPIQAVDLSVFALAGVFRLGGHVELGEKFVLVADHVLLLLVGNSSRGGKSHGESLSGSGGFPQID